MRIEPRFVFDTNVLVSALIFPGSVPERAFRAAFEQGVILTSTATLEELTRVVRRPKLRAYVEEGERELFVRRFTGAARMITIVERVTLCRNPKDDKFLELDPFRTTAIVSPAGLLDRLG